MYIFDYFGYIIIINFLWRFSRFISTPILKYTGFYKYYAPMFFTMPLGMNNLDFHLGTSWDFTFQKNRSIKMQFAWLTEGLINLCKEIESGKIAKHTTFTGTTFYIKDSTLNQYGFRYRSLNLWEKFLFVLNFAELTILYSISRGKFTFIPLKDVKVVYTSAADIVIQKEKFITLLKRINPKAAYFNMREKLAKKADYSREHSG